MTSNFPGPGNTSQSTTPAASPPRTGGPPGYVEAAEAEVTKPFKGITTDGNVLPGLNSIQKTGVSAQPVRAAAEAFLNSLSPEQRARTLFPIDTVEWHKWSNIHRTLMRHGT